MELIVQFVTWKTTWRNQTEYVFASGDQLQISIYTGPLHKIPAQPNDTLKCPSHSQPKVVP